MRLLPCCAWADILPAFVTNFATAAALAEQYALLNVIFVQNKMICPLTILNNEYTPRVKKDTRLLPITSPKC